MVLRNLVVSQQRTNVASKLATLAGSAGAMITGETIAAPVSYVPTAGVAAAQNIPGFTYTSPTNVTPGTLRPPATVGDTAWDVDGDGNADFNLTHGVLSALQLGILAPLSPFANPNGLLQQDVGSGTYMVRNLSNSAVVGPSATSWRSEGAYLTYSRAGVGVNLQSFLTTNDTGYFGFRFAFGNSPNDYFYGWASLMIDFGGTPNLPGQGFKIMEAFYQSTPNLAIEVGQVPDASPVPELPANTSAITLLAFGIAGLDAWRTRKRAPAHGA
jgi:hypothetical protein